MLAFSHVTAFSATPHRAANEDHLDLAFHDANSFSAPSQFSYATTNEYDYVSNAPQQDHQIANDGFLGRSSTYVNWSSAPSQTLHGSHHFTGEELPGANFDWSFAPLPVPQGPYRFAGGEPSDPTLDWSSAPPAVSGGYSYGR